MLRTASFVTEDSSVGNCHKTKYSVLKSLIPVSSETSLRTCRSFLLNTTSLSNVYIYFSSSLWFLSHLLSLMHHLVCSHTMFVSYTYIGKYLISLSSCIVNVGGGNNGIRFFKKSHKRQFYFLKKLTYFRITSEYFRLVAFYKIP